MLSFRSNMSSGFTDISALEQFFFKRSVSSLPSLLFVCPLSGQEEKTSKIHFPSYCADYFQLFGSENNEIICIFNGSSLLYSKNPSSLFTLWVCTLSIKLSTQNRAENRKRCGHMEQTRNCNGYPLSQKCCDEDGVGGSLWLTASVSALKS